MSELELYIPTPTELETLSPADRWSLEDQMGEAQGVLREFNDEELRQWVEVEGKTQTEIAKLVGRSQQRISQRCAALGIRAADPRGKGFTSPSKTDDEEEVADTEDAEVLDGEIVDDDEAPARRSEDPNRALLEQIIWWVSDCPDAVNGIPVERVVADTSPGELQEWRSGFAKGMAALRALKRRLEPPK